MGPYISSTGGFGVRNENATWLDSLWRIPPTLCQGFIFDRGVSPPAIPFLLVVSRHCRIFLSRLDYFVENHSSYKLGRYSLAVEMIHERWKRQKAG